MASGKARPNYQFTCKACGAVCHKYARPSSPLPEFCDKSCAISWGRRNLPWHLPTGPEHHAWQGDRASVKAGRARALHAFKNPGACWCCGATKNIERHHVNGNTRDNSIGNVEILCRRCHMSTDGRLERFRAMAKVQQPRALVARWAK